MELEQYSVKLISVGAASAVVNSGRCLHSSEVMYSIIQFAMLSWFVLFRRAELPGHAINALNVGHLRCHCQLCAGFCDCGRYFQKHLLLAR
jgi:hypothetical protein